MRKGGGSGGWQKINLKGIQASNTIILVELKKKKKTTKTNNNNNNNNKEKDKQKKTQPPFFSEAVLFDPKLQEIRKQAIKEIESDENLETSWGRKKTLKAIRQILASYGFDGNEWKKNLYF
jgi:hypothetical protein